MTAGALLVLAACGDSDSSGTSGGSERASADTRTVRDTLNGDIADVPRNPERVVALWRTGTELADMGVKPVAALEGEFTKRELDAKTFAKVKDVPTVGSFEGVDVEKVLNADPDLIVGMDHGGLSIDYKELEEIAPTVILKIKEPTDVWRNYPKLADVLGRSTDFAKRNTALDESLTAVKRRFGEKVDRAKAVHLNVEGGKTWISTSKSLTWERIDAAGFDYLDTYTKKPERYVAELATENLPDLHDADVILYSVDLHGRKTPDLDKLLKTESFQRLPAAKVDNVFPVTSGTIYTFPAAKQQVRELTSAAKRFTPEGKSS
ncbi:hypothetical protein AN216_07980 [Streptomyces oceani]|uniref:Fe/B12 periplasmic-binding domain-containing protein n=1 Tax=Streptomyces oceani TaxID=1075402 RepID=A0A1E7KJQ3_9ACTN|nr:hypothetical protein AN216_07980 [Streptomyces oceani]